MLSSCTVLCALISSGYSTQNLTTERHLTMNTTLRSHAKFYARHALEFIGEDNGREFTRMAHHTGSTTYRLARYAYSISVSVTFDTATGDIVVYAFDGYGTATETRNVSDYTPSGDDYVLAA